MRNFKIEIKWGLLFVLMMLAWMVMEKLAGFHDVRIAQHAIVTNLIAIPAVTIYVLALLDKRKNDLDGKMTYKQGVISGLIITAVVTVLSPLVQYITSTLITPEFFTNMIAYAVEQGNMTQQEAEDFFNLKNYLIQSTMGAPIMGLLTTLIVAIFVRKK